MSQPSNPYGMRPGGGISLPDYYRPWESIKNRNMYLPGTEILPKNEMRISLMISCKKGTNFLPWFIPAAAIKSSLPIRD